MTIQLTYPAVDKFDPDPAIQEWLKGRRRKRIPKLKRTRIQTVELPVAGDEFIER